MWGGNSVRFCPSLLFISAFQQTPPGLDPGLEVTSVLRGYAELGPPKLSYVCRGSGFCRTVSPFIHSTWEMRWLERSIFHFPIQNAFWLRSATRVHVHLPDFSGTRLFNGLFRNWFFEDVNFDELGAPRSRRNAFGNISHNGGP